MIRKARHVLWVALPLVACVSGCARQDKTNPAKSVQSAESEQRVERSSPVAGFGRMVGGEWKMTAQAGTSLYDTWHWGPGRQSLRVMTQGEAADHSPWRAIGAVYWHPGRKQVCMLGLNPFERTVSDGTVEFAGETAEAVSDLFQRGVRRKIAQRWAFEGPDRFHTMLLESTGGGAFSPLVEWDYVRLQTVRSVELSRGVAARGDDAPKPSPWLRPVTSLLGSWETGGQAKGDWAERPESRLRWSVEWVPYVDAVYARGETLAKDKNPVHVLDVYAYHHTGTGALHCLALSAGGGVYEGDVTAGEDGALQVELAGYEGERIVRQVVRVEREGERAMRGQVWSDAGDRHKLLIDMLYRMPDSR